MEKGEIRINTENIFPIIKKAVYSDHEIFLRELVSNGVDAISKRRMAILLLLIASTPLLTSSLKKISWSEYTAFLIIGKIFSVLIRISPFSI